MRNSSRNGDRSDRGLRGSALTRRGFLQTTLASAGAMLLTPRAVTAAAPKLEGEVVYGCNGGLLEKLSREMGAPFEKATGIKVTYVVNTQMGHLAKVRAAKDRPDMDVNFTSELSHAAGKKLGLYEKLDPGVVTNLAQVYSMGADPDGIGVVSSLTSIGIGYNKQKYQEAGIPAPTSWNDLWDPRLKGKLAICSFSVTWIQHFLVLIARLAGGGEDNIKPGIARIKELKTMGNLALMPGTPAELENILTQGIAWTTVTASIRAYGLQDQGYPFDFVYPKEGGTFYANYFDVIKKAPHPHAAQAFVNYALSEEAQQIMAKGFYGPINKNVKLPPDLARKAPYGAQRVNSLVKLDWDKGNEKLDEWNELWNREIEAK